MTIHIRRAPGFTLISVMLTVAIIGILAAIAYPSYIHQVRASRRSDARASLLWVAAREEQFYSEYNSYGSLEALGYTTPLYSKSKWYQLAASQLDNGAGAAQGSSPGALPSRAEIDAGMAAHSYVLSAQPRNDQIHDACAGLTLDSLGRRDIITTTNTGMTAEDCW